MQGCRDAEMQGCRDGGMQRCRDAGILVSIVVSIPACHAGDPGSIPGREVVVRSLLLA